MRSPAESDSTLIDTLAQTSGFSADAVASMIDSVRAGGGGMAQFDHPAFGGAGQWMRGGMLMIGDFSNDDLRRRVGLLCDAIAERLGAVGPSSTGGAGSMPNPDDTAHARHPWWPATLGNPDTSGAQNDMRYAWFSQPARLAIDLGGHVTVYDTADHRIGGVSQQQGGRRTLAFTSQHGAIDLARLTVVEGAPREPLDAGTVKRNAGSPSASEDSLSRDDVFGALEKLAALHARGILSADEFATKKSELLARI